MTKNPIHPPGGPAVILSKNKLVLTPVNWFYNTLINTTMNRFSVLYFLNEQYHHVGSNSHDEAVALLNKLQTTIKRIPVGIYDAKTELFEWEPNQDKQYNRADIEEQGRMGKQIITIAQALRRRDSSWQPTFGFRRPSFFA